MSDKHTDAQGELSLIELLESCKPNYGDFGTRDVDVSAKRVTIEEAIRRLRIAGPEFASGGFFRVTEGQAQTSAADDDSFKPVYWFSVLTKCARLLNVPTDQPIPSGVMKAVEAMVEKSAERMRRKAFICTNCDGVYADAPVTRCDCMPEVQSFVEGVISYPDAAQLADSTAPGAPVIPSNEELDELYESHVGHPADFAADVLERWGGWPMGVLGQGGSGVLLSAPTAQQSLTAGGTVGALLELRANIYDLQENLEAFGEHSQNVAHAALDGAIEALDEVAERYSSVPCAKTAEDVEEEFARTLPGPFYMDLPDGGSPSILEQVRRMAQDAARFRWLNTYHADGETRWCAHMLAKRLFHGDYDDVARDIDAEMKKDIQK